MDNKKTKDQWVTDNLFTLQNILESKYNGGLACPICHNHAGWGIPYEQPKDEYMKVLCGRCGYVMEFHLDYVKANLKEGNLDNKEKAGDNE